MIGKGGKKPVRVYEPHVCYTCVNEKQKKSGAENMCLSQHKQFTL